MRLSNLDILKQRFSNISCMIETAQDDISLKVIETKHGPVPQASIGGREVLIHSKFDPVKEAERFLAEIKTGEFDLFIVFGFGFGYHIESLLKRMSRDSLVLVIEKNPFILKTALEQRDMAQVLKDERFFLLLEPGEDSIGEVLKGRSSRRVSFLIHRGSLQLYPEYYQNMSELARSYLSTKEVNIATLAKFEKIWSSNIARNISRVIECPGVNSFYGKFSDVPAIVVAAGPSLIKSLDFIKANRDRAVVVAVDTAYKILLRNGIVPHFCVAVDPQPVNARYFEGVDETSSVLVTDPTVHPSVFRFFRGRAATTGVAFNLLKWIEEFSGDKGEITHGGSVSTNAYDFARRLGVSGVILVGQDLAFTWGQAHARGSYLDEQIHMRTTRLYSAEMFNRFQLTALPKIFVRGIKSARVHTNQKMMIFLSWFEKAADGRITNATYDGAMMNGIRHADTSEVSIPEPGENIENRISRIYEESLVSSENTHIMADKLHNKLGKMSSELDSLVPVLSRGVGFSRNLVSLMKNPKRDRSKLDYLLGKLSETDRIVESKENIKGMISLTIQKVLHTITEGHEMDENDSALGKDDLIAKKSEYLYNGLLEGALFNKKIFKKMGIMLRK